MNSFLKNLSWLLLLNLLVKPIWIFFIDREVQNRIGYEAYGSYFAVLNLSYVLFFMSDAGLSNMINQQLAKREAVNLKQLFRIKASLLLSYFICLSFIAWLTHIPNWTILLYIILIQVFTSVFLFLRSIITAHQYFYADAWFSVIDKLLMILICGMALYGGFRNHFTLIAFLQIQSLCTALAALAAAAFLFSRQRRMSTGPQLQNIFQLTFPFALAVVLMSMHYRLDAFLLERMHFHGPTEAGIYAAAYRLLDASNMVGYLGASFLVPFLARNWNDRKLIDATILDLRHGLMFFAIGITSFCLVFAPWLQNLLYHTSNGYHTEVIQLTIAVLPAYFLTHIYGSIFTANRQFKPFIVILLSCVLINIILNLILIPSYGAKGCCISAIMSQYVCALACYFVATKKYTLHKGIFSLGVYILCALFITAFFYLAPSFIKNVWIILASGALMILAILATQLSFGKKYIPSRR